MRKKIVSFLLVLAIVCGSGISVFASEKDTMLDLLKEAKKQTYFFDGDISIWDITDTGDTYYSPLLSINAAGGIEDGQVKFSQFYYDSYNFEDFINNYFDYEIYDFDALAEEDYFDGLIDELEALYEMYDLYEYGVFLSLSDDETSFIYMTGDEKFTIAEKPFEKGVISLGKYFMADGIKYAPIYSDEDYFEVWAILSKEMTEELENEFAVFLEEIVFNSVEIEDINVGNPLISFSVSKETGLIDYMRLGATVEYTAYGMEKTIKIDYEAEVTIAEESDFDDGYTSIEETLKAELPALLQDAKITEKITPVIDYMQIIGESLTWERMLEK